MEPGSRPSSPARPASNYVTRTIAGETILVPIRAEAAQLDSVYVFNEVGARIWSLIEEGKDQEAIVAALAAEFDVELDRARADLRAFVGLLKEAGLVEPEPAA